MYVPGHTTRERLRESLMGVPDKHVAKSRNAVISGTDGPKRSAQTRLAFIVNGGLEHAQ